MARRLAKGGTPANHAGRGGGGLGYGGGDGGVRAVAWEVTPAVGVVHVVIGCVVGVGVGVMGVVRIFLREVGVDHHDWHEVDKIGVLQFDVHLERIFGPVHL